MSQGVGHGEGGSFLSQPHRAFSFFFLFIWHWRLHEIERPAWTWSGARGRIKDDKDLTGYV
jgi:hypothetical protein